MADPLDLHALMGRLALDRPIFHSEADFQHALAWQVHREHPSVQVRLEMRPERGIHLDLLFILDGRRVAAEVKYLRKRFDGVVAGERYDLPNGGAQDLGRYDLIKDITRLERFVADGVADLGWGITLTNDSSYWRPGTKAEPIDAMFRVHEGRTLQGELRWSDRAGGTTAGRTQPHLLRARYPCEWLDYSTVVLPDGQIVPLRYLAFEVQ